MKVILKEDVKKVGKKGDIVDVADGYARNYLIARGLAVSESKKSLEILDEQKKEQASVEKQKEEDAKELAKRLEDMVFEFHVNSGKDGKVFGSVSTKQIAEECAKQGIQIDKRKILDTSPIQELGISEVQVELYKNVIGTIKVKLIGSE